MVCRPGHDIVLPFLFQSDGVVTSNVESIVVQVRCEEVYGCPKEVFQKLLDPFECGLFEELECPWSLC